MGLSRNRRRIIFFAMLLLTLFPLFFFPIRSAFAHQFYQFPQLQGGSLDLSGYDLSSRRAIPLDGEWEFFYGRWIVSEGSSEAESGPLVPVPRPWTRYEGFDWDGVTDKASYRITLKNCLDGQEVLCYIPNICANYRIYLNGTLIASRGSMEPLFGGRETAATIMPILRQGRPVPTGSDAELVIELRSHQVGGLYMTPVLTEQESSHVWSDQRSIMEAVCLGIIAATLLFLTYLQVLRDNLLSSSSLLILDLLVFVRILVQNDHLSFLQPFIPLRTYSLSLLLQIITLFLPVVLLFCVRKLIHTQIVTRDILKIFCFEVILAPLILIFALNGRLGFSQLLCIVSYLPCLYVICLLYQGVMRDSPYSLLVSAAFMLAISSMIAVFQDFSGWLTMHIDLYPPACFALSMFFQLLIALQHSLDIQKQVVESERLRLQLRESELKLRLSQIKPHFLYNTLLAIHMLCTEAPETAAETTMKFATFLRTNMNFIESQDLIPFEQELAHVQNYTDIELLRFQRRLSVRLDIQTTDFSVPPLSIQPLVENAIRHGACKNIKGGTVILSTRETEDGFLVEILDDGPGFDPDSVLQDPTSAHGLPNILFRLREQRGALVELLSKPGAGARVRITLPKEETT